MRVHATQLRKKLREYYEVNRSNLSVRITIPPGSYKPVFEEVKHALVPEVVDDRAQLAIASDSPGLLVLPCADLDAPGRSSFSDGVTDELIIALANLTDMRVVPGLHHFCASTELFIRRAARRGVTAVLDTSVRCAGERIRMTVRLLHVHTLHIAWAQRFEAHAANVFVSQEKLAHAVAEAVAAQFGLSNVRASLE